jgi:hypothetical protein
LLTFVGGMEDLTDRVVQLADRVAQVDLLRVGIGADRVPGSLPVRPRPLLGGAGVGQRETSLAVDLLAADQALVLEYLQRRVIEPALGTQAPGETPWRETALAVAMRR